MINSKVKVNISLMMVRSMLEDGMRASSTVRENLFQVTKSRSVDGSLETEMETGFRRSLSRTQYLS